MTALVLTGWRTGLNKVSLTKLLQDELRIPLHEAKQHTDDLLAGNSVELIVSREQADRIAEEVQRLGVIVERTS